MRPFAYSRPQSLEEAMRLGAEPGAKFLAGGTNLVDLMKLEVEQPTGVVDLGAVLDREIRELDGGGVRIGAGVRNTELGADPVIRRKYPAVSRAVLAGASGQVRNLATTGGNLLQRNRCVYFQDVSRPCNKRDPGSGCPAVATGGASRGLAIFARDPVCIATHTSDLAVALTAFDAELVIAGNDGERRVPIEGFYTFDGHEPGRETVMGPGEIIVAVELPALSFAPNSRYAKVRDRASFAFALVSVAAALDVEADTIVGARLALGGVAHKPWRAHTAERALLGAAPTPDTFASAITAELGSATPTADNAFKVTLARNLVVSTLTGLA